MASVRKCLCHRRCVLRSKRLTSSLRAPQYGIDLPQFGAADMNVPTFRTLTTYSWEQSDMLVKIYVPLRGVQTDLLRCCSLDASFASIPITGWDRGRARSEPSRGSDVSYG